MFLIFSIPFLALGQSFNVSADSINGLNEKRKTTMLMAIEVFKQVMNAPDFKKKLLKKKFYYDRKEDPNKDLTTAEIVNKIFRGEEKFKKDADFRANIYWIVKECERPKNQKRPALGAGLRENPFFFYTNSWFIDDPKKFNNLVGHLAHEWSHKLGFMHEEKHHKKRPGTVPYSFGYLVATYAKIYLPKDLQKGEKKELWEISELETFN